MRDIDRLPISDDAYTAPSSGGMPPDAAEGEDPPVPLFEDPSFTDTKAYGMPSLGGEFGPGMVPVLSGPDDGGAALLEAGATYVAPPALVIPTPASTLAGRAMNATFRTNLFPWFATPKAGLSSNRSSTPPVMEDPPPPPPPGPPPPSQDPPIQMSPVTLQNGNAAASFSGRALADAVVHIRYVICGDLRSTSINILSGATAATIAAAIRAALRAMGDLWVSGAGGQITAHSLVSKNPITDFEISIERD